MHSILMRRIDRGLPKVCLTCDRPADMHRFFVSHRELNRRHPFVTYIINETDIYAVIQCESKVRPYHGYIEIDACKYCMDDYRLSCSEDETDLGYYWIGIKKYNKKPELY